MARSSLLGIDPAAAEPAGRDKASLGPSDSSDSGSDVMGMDGEDDGADPGLPVDVALRDDQAAPLPLGESLPSSEGETGVRDGADIGVDRVFTPDEANDDEALLAVIDEAPLSEDDEEDEGQEEGEEAAGEANLANTPAKPRRRTSKGAPAQTDSEERPGDADAESSHRPGRS
ncbi:hypothetical protein ASC95_01635 [Pelomonas sp. Root1217]|uniref:hypothetical protein n=1 Tax=Pelomonas sp. Root1217 TaxID=1736430 RepID=UPI00070A46E4|nr:hypothetical protein [Pelomonas sp. Root1217]KQV60202.1 hypothetical protein ASC95_01635 [Pelomonas sp. Root1217]